MVTTTRPALPWTLLTALLFAVYVGLALAAPPGMVPDAARGFMVWQSMQRGSAFNVVREPDSRDLSHDGDSFMTWWTPGQYAVPASFNALQLNLGHAILATLIVCVLGGLAGGYVLFRALGFGPDIAAASVSIIAAWRYVSVSFRSYTGGEILLFGIAPWAIWLALKCRRLGSGDVLTLVVVILAGIFLKSAFVVCALAMLISLGVIRLLERRVTPVYIAKLAVCFMLPCAIYYMAFGRFGATPAGLFAESKKGVFGLLFAVSTPLFAATSLSDVVNRVFLYPAAPRLTAPEHLWPLFLAGAAAAVVCYLQMFRRSPGTLYRGLLGGFLLTYIAAFGVLFLLGAAVNTDDRYFRPPAFLVVPGLLHAMVALRPRAFRAAALGTVGALAVYGPLAYLTHWPAHHREPVGRLGFTHEEISAEALSRLDALDQDMPPGSVFYVVTPALALELQRARAITANAIFESTATLSAREYRGHVDNLVVAVPASLGPDRTNAILTSFRDFSRDRWARESSGDYVFYSQTAVPR
jgi:hypothetical protein